MTPRLRFVYLFSLLLCVANICQAQSHLSKTVTVYATDERLEDVLKEISKQGDFFFSYNSKIIPDDSLISLTVKEKTVLEALNFIFKQQFEFKETPSHVIIQNHSAGQYWYVSGYVKDLATGENVRDVSVFEKEQLVASMTNEQGYFKLRLKEKVPSISLNVSKSLYRDTIINIKPGVDQEVTVKIAPKRIELQEAIINSSGKYVENTWFARLFLSSKQRLQSINLNKFFVDMPVQGSIFPGLGSQGKMTSQTTNNLSLNLIGGYTAGVEGLELGGVFNIVKNDAKYVQAGGLVNVVGGSFKGFQGAGFHNNVLGTFDGVQASGFSNITRGNLVGLQAAGVYNLTIGKVDGAQYSGIINMSIDTVTGAQMAGVVNSSIKPVRGIQAAGIVNFGVKEIKGVQMAGVLNFSTQRVRGAQISGLVNYATDYRGLQMGLFNFADTASGAAIGIFNFVLKGYHKLSVYTNEYGTYNVSFKSGTKWLYNIYSMGVRNYTDKVYTYGLGWGSELSLSKRFSINPELAAEGIYMGSWEDINSLVKLRVNLNVHFGKYVAIYAGPTYNTYYDNNITKVAGYSNELLPNNYKRNTYDSNLSSWIGWNVGVTIF